MYFSRFEVGADPQKIKSFDRKSLIEKTSGRGAAGDFEGGRMSQRPMKREGLKGGKRRGQLIQIEGPFQLTQREEIQFGRRQVSAGLVQLLIGGIGWKRCEIDEDPVSF